ncbi:MAG: MFS transporter [Acidobacteria bacterium]|nr:MFS transporter [Acidobacteriota bacterium]
MKHKAGLLILSLSYLSFVSLGLPDGLNGVAWPSIRAYFNLPLDALGELLLMFTIGYLVSSFSSGRLLARMSVGTLLALSCLATAMSLIGYALVPVWSMMVALGMVAGLGAGAIDAGLNTFAARRFSPRMVNWLHACYGIGAASGPVIMTSFLAAHYPWQRGYALVGLWQLILAVCFGITRRWWPRANVAQKDSNLSAKTMASNLNTLRLPVVWVSIAVFFVYTGIELSAGVWAFSLFSEARGISTMTAGAWVSLYWGGLTTGRLLLGFVVGHLPMPRLLRFCIVSLALGAALIWIDLTNLISFLGLGLMGFAAAPIFPSLIAATPERLGEAHTANGIGFQIAAAVLGQSLMPALVGWLAGQFGLEIVGPALLTAALLLLALFELMMTTSLKLTTDSAAST